MSHCWELSQQPADEVLSSLPRDSAKGFFSPLEVRWLFKCGEEDDSKHMLCFLLAAVWDCSPPVYDWFLICFHSSFAVPKSRNKRAEEQQKSEKTQNSIHHPQPLLLGIFCNIFMSGRTACDERIYGSNSLFLHSHHILWPPASLKHLTSLFQPSASAFEFQCLKCFCPCSLILPTGFIC